VSAVREGSRVRVGSKIGTVEYVSACCDTPHPISTTARALVVFDGPEEASAVYPVRALTLL
jgi:hypothetical protein